MHGKVGPCGTGVARSLGKTEVMGSNPITGSRVFSRIVQPDVLYTLVSSSGNSRRTKKLLLPSSEQIVTLVSVLYTVRKYLRWDGQSIRGWLLHVYTCCHLIASRV